MKKRLLSCCPIADPAARERIARHYEITECEKITEPELAERIADFHAVIVPFTSEMLVTERVVDAGVKLELIASSYGGTRQNIADLYALAKGVTLIHTGASRERPMAEYTLALVLSSLLRIHNYHADMTTGGEAWPRMKYPRTRILHNRKVAIVGYGRIGRAIANLFRCFTGDIAVASRHLTEEAAAADQVRRVSVNDAFAQSEIIILAGGHTPETHRMVGREQFELMRDSALFVNIARGKMVDQAAMIEAVGRRNIFLALDVFENEPLEADSPLRKCDRVLLTPHRANNSIEFEERWQNLADDIDCLAAGGRPDSALTQERANNMSES